MRADMLTSVLLILAVSAGAQDVRQVVDFEDLDKTMSAFELAVEKGDAKLLAAISANSFQSTAFYKRLLDQLGTLKVNSGVSSQIAEQTFTMDPGSREVTVTFELRNDRWVVVGSSENDVIRSFPMLAREYRFSDFRRAVEGNELATLAGVAPYGQLPTSTFRGKKLDPKPETTVTLTNLLLHDGSKVKEVFYVRARKSMKVDAGSRGWLLYEAGPMLKLQRMKVQERPLIDFLSGNAESFDLGKKSAFQFANAAADNGPSLPLKHVDYKVVKVSTTSFKWEGDRVRFLLVIDCEGASWPPKLKVALDRGRLVLDAQSDVRFVGKVLAHRYLKAETTNGKLSIFVDQDVTKRPIATFEGAAVKGQNAVSLRGGLRITLEIEGKRLPEAAAHDRR